MPNANLGTKTFGDCVSFMSIKVPVGFVSLGEHAFYDGYASSSSSLCPLHWHAHPHSQSSTGQQKSQNVPSPG